MRKIVLDASRMKSRGEVHDYMQELFAFPDYYGHNLDALYDCLCELNEDTDFILTRDNVSAICTDTYAYTTLMVIGKASEANDHIHIHFQHKEEQKEEP